jgi:hypothetical protein
MFTKWLVMVMLHSKKYHHFCSNCNTETLRTFDTITNRLCGQVGLAVNVPDSIPKVSGSNLGHVAAYHYSDLGSFPRLQVLSKQL